jgi:DNA replication protein DnaC
MPPGSAAPWTWRWLRRPGGAPARPGRRLARVAPRRAGASEAGCWASSRSGAAPGELNAYDCFSPAIRLQVERLRRGSFLDEAVNVVAVGKPGTGKSHLLAALAHVLILLGHPVLWTSTASLVQRLLAAKRDLRLPQMLAQLDRYAWVILDDIGYVQHDRDEMEVLFTLLAERYERRSVGITTNLVFSDWTRIFKDPMTTLAAIDRVVHHAVILVLMALESYRAKEATQQQTRGAPRTAQAASG